MTEPREPYIAGYKKSVIIQGRIEGARYREFKDSFIDFCMDKGWAFDGDIEVSYEEE